jgi:hypothetical protein
LSIVGAFGRLVDDPPLAGGCPVLNTAVESDDAHPGLYRKAQQAMDQWHYLVTEIVTEGIARGEIRAGIDGVEVATILTATLEGAVMLSKLYRDNRYMAWSVAHLEKYIQNEIRAY